MQQQIAKLNETISELQDLLEVELARRRAELNVGLERGRVVFDDEILRRHRELKIGFWAFIRKARFGTVITAPFIYSVIVPFVLLDIFVSIYQAVCFPVYGIEKVRRADYLIFDRHHLGYLNALQKLNCAYCSYGNGLMSYAGEIAARTEKYWCPIKHARRVVGAHSYYPSFSDFGDADAYQQDLDRLRDEFALQSKPQSENPDA